MQWSPAGTKIATNIFEAACWHYAVKPICSCGHSATFDPHGLWWHFERHGWNDNLIDARRHLWCRICRSSIRRKINPATIELVQECEADIVLPLPPERDWKRAISNMRT